jgi:hypothetical protein
MPEQRLDHHEFRTRIEEMSRKAVSENVRGAGTSDARVESGQNAGFADRVGIQWELRLFGREEPFRGAIDEPVLAKFAEESRRENDESFFAAFAIANVEEHLFGVDVGDLELAGFLNAKSGGVTGHEDGAVFGNLNRVEEGVNFLDGKNGGKWLGRFAGKRDSDDDFGASEGDGEEEFDDGEELSVGIVVSVLLVDLVEEEGFEVVRVELFEGFADGSEEDFGEEEIVPDRGRSEPTEQEVLFEALKQGRHEKLLVRRKGDQDVMSDSQRPQEKC